MNLCKARIVSWVSTSLTSVRPCFALRQTVREGYGFAQLRSDVMAGAVVGVVAIPLSMALAIASGVPPEHGLYTAIVAGVLIGILGGSRVQVSGPTAAFVVILAPISARYGLQGLAMASAMAGVLLMLMGVMRLGRLIEFIPYPVTTGFTAGIAVVIATLQLKDFFGLSVTASGPDAMYLEKVWRIGEAMPTVQWSDMAIGALTLTILVLWPRVTRKVPAALMALGVSGVLGYGLNHYLAGDTIAGVATVAEQFGGIPNVPPMPIWPWHDPGPMSNGGVSMPVTLDLIRELLPAAFTIAMLGAIESLLSAVVADGMAQTRHDPDTELFAQGIGNIVAPCFGGFAATGAIARTATNIRSGARSPVATVVHAVVVLLAVVTLAPILGELPMASMAALLLMVAWNMSERKHFLHMLQVAPRSDVMVLLTCFTLTVLIDMTVAVTVGVALAAMLFMRRMAAISGSRLISAVHPVSDEPLPADVVVFEVRGPLFFGAAQKAISQLRTVDRAVKVVVIDLSSVPAMDVTGMVALESAVDSLYHDGIHTILGGVQDQPRRVLDRAHWHKGEGRLEICGDLSKAVEVARAMAVLV